MPNHSKKIIELDENNLCFHEFEYYSPSKAPVLAPSHMDVTSRTDGPFLGKVYEAATDTFSDPPAPATPPPGE